MNGMKFALSNFSQKKLPKQSENRDSEDPILDTDADIEICLYFFFSLFLSNL
jgi:hypothetical protein